MITLRSKRGNILQCKLWTLFVLIVSFRILWKFNCGHIIYRRYFSCFSSHQMLGNALHCRTFTITLSKHSATLPNTRPSVSLVCFPVTSWATEMCLFPSFGSKSSIYISRTLISLCLFSVAPVLWWGVHNL